MVEATDEPVYFLDCFNLRKFWKYSNHMKPKVVSHFVMLSYHTNPSGVLFTDMTDRPDSLSFGEGRGEAVIGSDSEASHNFITGGDSSLRNPVCGTK